MQIQVTVNDANNITCEVTPPAEQLITIDRGVAGPAATIAVGTTTTLSAGSSATVTNVGNSSAAVFDFGIPQGANGATGATGPAGPTGPAGAAATATAGTTTTLPPGSPATVTNVGTTSAAIFDFAIPQGLPGTGSGSVTSVDVSGGTTGLTTSGGPVTTSGTISLAGTLVAANGGTGLTSPGANGNVLTSNGSAWTSSALPAQVYPSAGIPVSTGTAWSTSKTSPSGDIVGTTDTQTLTNKTLTSPVLNTATASGITLNDGYTEEVFAVTGTTPALSPTNGSIQTWTLSGNSTPTAGTWAAGQSITLMVNDTASAFTVTWTSMPVIWVGGSAPTLAPAGGNTVIVFWKVGTTIYGALSGQVA